MRKQALKLSDLLAKVGGQGMPVVSTAKDKQRAAWLSKSLVAQKFAVAYVESGMDMATAYQVLRPNVSKYSARTGGANMLRKPLVKRFVTDLLRPALKDAETNVGYVIAQARAQAESNMFDFIKYDEHGNPYLDLNPDNLTLAQQINVRALRFDAKTGNITGVTLPDRTAATALLLRAVMGEDEARIVADGIGEVLTNALARAQERKKAMAGKLTRGPNVYEMQAVKK